MFAPIIVLFCNFFTLLLMTKLKYITVLFIVASFFTSCAKRGTITGGPKDTIAPKIVGSFPENFSTNFKGNEIKINFNELIKVKDITKQLIISPPMKKQPVIVPQGSASKFISIKICPFYCNICIIFFNLSCIF